MTSEETGKTERTTRRASLLLLLALLLAVAAAFLVVRPWKPDPAEVRIEEVGAQAISLVLALNGNVKAELEVPVRSAVVGRAISVHAREGDTVSAGDKLVTIDDAIAQAQFDQAKASLDAQDVRLEQSKLALERARALGANISRASLEDALLAFEAASRERARLNAALDQAQRETEQYVIRAPVDGVVLSRSIDPGQLTDVQTELFVVADLDQTVVEAAVDEQYSARVEKGQKALLLPVGSSHPVDGQVSFVAPRVDPATGGREVRIAFVPPQILPVGLTVNANLIVEELDAALSIPRAAIKAEGSAAYVFLAQDGVAVRRNIVFNDWPAERVIVTGGLEAGDLVILDPGAVKLGELVTPVR